MQLDLAADGAAPVELTGHFSGLNRMEKLFVIALLVVNFAAFGRAQNPSPATSPSPAAPPPQNQGPVVAASPAPMPAPVLETKLVVSILEQKLAVVVNDKIYRTYKISTSRYGEGDAWGSWCTPTGRLAVEQRLAPRRRLGEFFKVDATPARFFR